MCIKEYIIVFLVTLLLVGCGNSQIHEPIGGDPELIRQMNEEIFQSKMKVKAEDITTMLATYCIEFDDYENLDGVDFFHEYQDAIMLKLIICLAQPTSNEHASYEAIATKTNDGHHFSVEEDMVKQILFELFRVEKIPENFDSYYDKETKTYCFGEDVKKTINKMEIVKSELTHSETKVTCKVTALDQSKQKTILFTFANYGDNSGFIRIKQIKDITTSL